MKYEIQVHDIQFTMIDEDGNELSNKDGSPKLFTLNSKCDASWIADSMEADWLEEWDYNIVSKNQELEKHGYTALEMLLFIRDQQISWETIGNPLEGDAEIEFFRKVGRFNVDQTLCTYPWEDKNSLIEGIMFLMDMEAQKYDDV